MAATANSATRALARVKSTPRPEFLRVLKDDDTDAQLAIPDIKKWKSRVGKTLDSLEWKSVTPVDAKGDIIGPTVENDEYEEYPDLEDISTTPSHAHDIHLLELLLKAQDVALSRQERGYQLVLKNNQELLQINLSRTISLEKTAHSNLETIKQLHDVINESDGGDSGEDAIVGDLVKMVVASKMGVSP